MGCRWGLRLLNPHPTVQLKSPKLSFKLNLAFSVDRVDRTLRTLMSHLSILSISGISRIRCHHRRHPLHRWHHHQDSRLLNLLHQFNQGRLK